MWFVTIPILTWITCGAIKFGVKVIRSRYDVVNRIGHGGFLSNHTAIVSSVMWALMSAGEWHMASFAVAVLMICVFDATGLRQEVGYHATAIGVSVARICWPQTLGYSRRPYGRVRSGGSLLVNWSNTIASPG